MKQGATPVGERTIRSMTNAEKVLTLDEYQTGAQSTAVYPNKGKNLYYPALGLAGESSELLEKVENNADASEISGEIGDVMWYAASLAFEAGLKFSEITGFETFKHPEGPVLPGNRFAADVVIAGGRVVEVVKKTLRDQGGVLDEARREKIKEGLNVMLASLSLVAATHGTNLEIAAKGNLDKLQSRKERGKLSGDGDTR